MDGKLKIFERYKVFEILTWLVFLSSSYSTLFFFESGIITLEKELKLGVAGVAQPLLLAKEEEVQKRTKPIEDKFCHEQVKNFFFFPWESLKKKYS